MRRPACTCPHPDPLVATEPVEPQPPHGPNDHVEAIVIPVTAVLILLTVPFAAAIETATHTRLEQQTRALRADEQKVPAVLLEDTHPAPDTPEDALRPTGTEDSVRWTTPHRNSTRPASVRRASAPGEPELISSSWVIPGPKGNRSECRGRLRDPRRCPSTAEPTHPEFSR